MKKNYLLLVLLVFCAFVFVGCDETVINGNSYSYSKTFSTDEELEFFSIKDYCTSLTGTYTITFYTHGSNIKLKTTPVFKDGAPEQAKEMIKGNCAAYEEALSKEITWRQPGSYIIGITIPGVPVFDAAPTRYTDSKTNKDVELSADIKGNNMIISFPELVAASMFITTDGNAATANFTLEQ